jgi:hypothetical protein
MTFQDCPLNLPILQRFRDTITAVGRKRRYGEHIAFVTPRQTWLYRPSERDLILVLPFKPEITLAGDGWELSQLLMYDIPQSDTATLS